MEDSNICTGEPGVESSGDWRSELLPDSRQGHVDTIMETLKRHLPVSGDEGLSELKKIAGRFEEKIYTAATSQSDYVRKVSLKLLTMETKFQDPPMGDSLLSNSMVPSNKPLDSTSQSMQSQVLNQGRSMPVPMSSNQPQSHQQLLSAQISSSLPSAVSPITGLASASMPNIVRLNQTMRNASGVPQNSVGNSMGLGVPSNVFSNSQRSILGIQVTSQQQQQQSQNQQQQLLLQQRLQLQQQIMRQKFQPGSKPQQLRQSHISQQQQNLMPPNQLQSSQQPVLQTSSVMQPSLSNLQQNQQSLIQQPTQSMLQQPPQPVLRQHQQSQQHPFLHQQPTMPQQINLPSQQQQKLISQPKFSNMQQNQLIGQQNSVGDMQQQLTQQSRLHGQQSNLSNMQFPPSQQQHQLMAPQNNLSNLQQQQLGPQSNVSGLQQQPMHGTQSGNSNMQSNQHSVHTLQQNKVQMQQTPQNTSNLLSTQASLDSTIQTGQANAGDWQKEIYPKSPKSGAVVKSLDFEVKSTRAFLGSNAPVDKILFEAIWKSKSHKKLLQPLEQQLLQSKQLLQSQQQQRKQQLHQRQNLLLKQQLMQQQQPQSVVSMIDMITGSASGNGSRAAVLDDLVARTECRPLARNFVSLDGPNGTKKMRRYTSATPLNVVFSARNVDDVFKPLAGAETSDLESPATSTVKRTRVEAQDWKSQLQPESRQQIINEIMEIMEKHLPVVGHEGLIELRKMVETFENEIYMTAINQILQSLEIED